MDKAVLSKYLSAVRFELICGYLASCRFSWGIKDDISKYSKFYFVVEGGCIITIEGREYILKPGDFALIPSGKIYSCKLTREKYLLKYWCDFNATVGNISIFDFIPTNYVIKIDDTEKLQEMFHGIFYNKNYYTLAEETRKNSLLSSILYEYMEKGVEHGTEVTNKIDFISVIKYMEENIKEKITINDLASVAYMHPTSFARAFNKAIGKPPIAFLNELRVETAKKSLAETDKHISDIALEVGIDDEFYFSRFFATHTGVSPAEYRNSLRT